MEAGGTMSTVLAAIDNSAVAAAVCATAETIGRSLGWQVEVMHVRADGDLGAREAAAAAGLELKELEGSPKECICEAAGRSEVTALVVGARDVTAGGALGSTAVALVTELDKPIVIVPPGVGPMRTLSRILIPLDASEANAEALRRGLELLQAAEVEIVLLHVGFGDSLPMFEDQRQHETSAWTEEFLNRYSPVAPKGVRLELRTGRPGEHVVDVAADVGAELIALGWKRDVGPGRAAIVHEVLMRSSTPVVLFPIPQAQE
jgi:nucleotide-binding universal stress UspA family protein